MDFSTLNVASENSKSYLEIFPNPVTSKFKVNSNNVMEALTLHSMSGEELLNKPVNNSETEVDINHLPPGIYLATVVFKNQKVQRLKIVKD